MEQALGYLVDLGPFYLIALVLGVGLAAASPWLLTHPERWLFLAIVFLSLISVGGSDSGSDGSTFKQATWGALFAYCGVWLVVTTKDWPALLRSVPGGLVLLLSFIAISILWSPAPLISLRRYVQLIGILFIGLVISRNSAQGRGLLNQLFLPLGAFLMLGLVHAVAMPGSAFSADRSLGALGTHKNTWGQFSLLCCLVFAVAMSTQNRARWRAAALLGMAVLSVIASRSTTSQLALGVLVLAVLCWLAINRGGRLGLLALLVTVMAALLSLHVFVVLNGKFPIDLVVEGVFDATGKNSTLTGRAQLWGLMFDEIARHPFLGIGYGGFWLGLDGASRAVIDRLNWGPPTQAHSGYIDVLNEIGIVGALVLVLALIGHLINILKLYRRGANDSALFHGALLICALIINYSETTFLRTTHLWWVVLCVSMIEVQSQRLRTSTLDSANGSTAAVSKG